MNNDGFEIEITSISLEKKMFYFTFLLLVVLVNVFVINFELFKENSSTSYINEQLSAFKTNSINNNLSYSFENNLSTSNIVSTYKCKNKDCKIFDNDSNTNDVIIYDNDYLIYNNATNRIIRLSLKGDYSYIKFINNKLAIQKDDKIAIYSIKADSFITDFIYDGIINTSFDGIEGSTYGTYIKTNKYNETLDISDVNDHVIKHYDYCTKLEEYNGKLLCSEHVQGTITDEEIENTLDKVLEQYPNLNNDRLFTIKTAIETVGLPYFWGGGHDTLKSTLNIARNTWNNEMCTVWGKGFDKQVEGQEYPCGLDCSGFARWVYYETTGIDIMSKGVSVIGGRKNHPDYTKISEEELLPGDLIMDKDHVVIYLYKNEKGKNISVHASFDHLQVEISNYRKGKEYYRLNVWNE